MTSILGFIGALTIIAITSSNYVLENNRAIETAKFFLKENRRLQDDIGEVKDFSWLSNSVVKGDSGTVWLRAIGTKRTQNVALKVMKDTDGNYKVTFANYENSLGQTVQLLEQTP